LPKPNRLLVGDACYVLDPEYLGGARAARAGYATGRGTAAWRAGERNEAALEHVRFGHDLLTLPCAGREIGEDPELPRLPGPGRPLHPDTALLAQMEATRSLREAGIACHDSRWIPDSWRFADPAGVDRLRADGAAYRLMRPARLRATLASRGVPVSPDMAKALLRRLQHEHQTRCEPLGYLEETALADAPAEVRLLLRVLHLRQRRDWLSPPLGASADSDARRPAGWTQGLVARMQAGELGFLVARTGAGGLRLTGKGCTAALSLARSADRAPRAYAYA
jgi:hypothetical protein